MRIYVEDWQVEYGRPNLAADDEETPEGSAKLVEDDDRLARHQGQAPPPERVSLACVDGVRRAEALLILPQESGEQAHGMAGALAYGAVSIQGQGRPVFGPCQVERLTIWGSSRSDATLPAGPGGWRWESMSVDSTEIHAPLRALENIMINRERKLAASLAETHRITLVDGPLHPLPDLPVPVVGYVKTHHRRWLDLALHRLVPLMDVGWRTSLFRVGTDRLSAYVRIDAPSSMGSPWAGIIRIEMFQSLGVERAAAIADQLAGLLPRFAGVAHRDPRAPQNLQPVGALENHLRRMLGVPGLATRAARDAVARLAVTSADAGTASAAAAAADAADVPVASARRRQAVG
ncbi:MAG TPA: hypothetical protein VNM90_26165 [Haliangium sp.]|nr:hypothetical protein [Haliangium sp.]